jgi:hypothetical protein
MSKKDELQKQLNALEHERTGHTKGVVYHQGEVNGIDTKISALEASIAEEAKPKLGHFDICKDSMGILHVVIHRTDAPDCVAGPTFLCDLAEPNEVGLTCIGNVQAAFDDLTSLQEDVTEFTLVRNDGKIINVELIGDCIQFHDNNDGHVTNMYLSKNPDAIMKLRQMHATHLRNEAKK